VVDWNNSLIWSYEALPHDLYLSHHDLEPMPNGNVLVMLWQRKSKEECLAAGRNPAAIPDGEIWDQLTIELAPDGKGGATIVWEWSLWDHLIQDYDEEKPG